jgi:hypothetical protein
VRSLVILFCRPRQNARRSAVSGRFRTFAARSGVPPPLMQPRGGSTPPTPVPAFQAGGHHGREPARGHGSDDGRRRFHRARHSADAEKPVHDGVVVERDEGVCITRTCAGESGVRRWRESLATGSRTWRLDRGGGRGVGLAITRQLTRVGDDARPARANGRRLPEPWPTRITMRTS